jgi:transcriptional regulator with XRE-family HTH domain
MGALRQTGPAPKPSPTLTKSVVRAAALLGLTQSALADVLGMSPATASRLVGGSYMLQPTRKREWEFALLFVRLYRSLDAIVGNERDVQTWLRSENHALGQRPLDLIRSAEGLVRVLQYLDASRSRI